MSKRKRRWSKPFTRVRVSYNGGYWKLGHSLERLGFSTYQEYLSSPLWNAIRREILYRDQSECLSLYCRRLTKIIQVHHLDYSLETLKGEQPWELVSLCKHCHELVEFSASGKKLNLYASRERTLRIVTGLRDNALIRQWLYGWRLGNRATLERIVNRVRSL